jgi:hypothetical protein
VLAEELGVEPGPELRRLESAVLGQDPSLDVVEGKRPPAAPSPPPLLRAQPDPDGPLGFHRAQLDRLQARIDSTLDGHGGTMVLVGEPGAGKTTLAEQGADMAEAAGLVVLWSRCLESEDARTVRLLSALAGELLFDEEAAVGFGYAERALDMGRRLADPDALGVAISSYLLSSRCNDRLDFRLPVIEEFLRTPAIGLAPDVEAVVRLNLLTERLRYGELTRFDAEIGRVWELATDILH